MFGVNDDNDDDRVWLEKLLPYHVGRRDDAGGRVVERLLRSRLMTATGEDVVRWESHGLHMHLGVDGIDRRRFRETWHLALRPRPGLYHQTFNL